MEKTNCYINNNKSHLNGTPLYKHNMIGSLGMSNHLHLHDRFTTLIDMKLYAQNQLYASTNS